jgi:hypothetical protein
VVLVSVPTVNTAEIEIQIDPGANAKSSPPPKVRPSQVRWQ